MSHNHIIDVLYSVVVCVILKKTYKYKYYTGQFVYFHNIPI